MEKWATKTACNFLRLLTVALAGMAMLLVDMTACASVEIIDIGAVGAHEQTINAGTIRLVVTLSKEITSVNTSEGTPYILLDNISDFAPLPLPEEGSFSVVTTFSGNGSYTTGGSSLVPGSVTVSISGVGTFTDNGDGTTTFSGSGSETVAIDYSAGNIGISLTPSASQIYSGKTITIGGKYFVAVAITLASATFAGYNANQLFFDYTVRGGDFSRAVDVSDGICLNGAVIKVATDDGEEDVPDGISLLSLVKDGGYNIQISSCYFSLDGTPTNTVYVSGKKAAMGKKSSQVIYCSGAILNDMEFAVSVECDDNVDITIADQYGGGGTINSYAGDVCYVSMPANAAMTISSTLLTETHEETRIRIRPKSAGADNIADLFIVYQDNVTVELPLKADGCLMSDFWAGVQGAVSWFCAGSVRIQNLTVEVDFGDGSHETVPCNANNAGVAFHTYSYPGLYYITLKATDSTGSTKTTRGFVKVNPQGYEGVTAAGNSGNGGNGEAMGGGEAGGGPGNVVAGVSLTVTNVIVHYVTQSIPSDAVIPSTTAGIVNVITEVDAGAPVAISPAWAEQYPDFEAKFGSDFSAAIVAETGKRDGAGNAMRVWQDFVAGTDPTDPDSVFTASITFDADTGLPVISWSPELSPEEAAKRTYRKYGKVRLTDENWTEIDGDEASYNFFKVSVEMK